MIEWMRSVMEGLYYTGGKIRQTRGDESIGVPVGLCGVHWDNLRVEGHFPSRRERSPD